jgi:hypothetical protein
VSAHGDRDRSDAHHQRSERRRSLWTSATSSYLDPSANPFTLLTRLANKRETVATSYYHFENRRKARFDTTSSTATTTIQTIPVTTGAYYAQWDLWQNTRTGEVFRVDGVAGNNITVTRNIAPSGVGTGTAMNSGDELMLVGTAQPENDTSKPARSDVPSKVTNNTQIFRTPLEASNTLRASGFAGQPDEWARQNKDKGIEHALDIESAFLFGKKSTTTPGSAADRTTAGILAHITTNQTDAGGDLSEAEWNAFMATIFTGLDGGREPQAVPRVGHGRRRAEQVPGQQAADPQRRDDLRHGRDHVHVAVRHGQAHLPPPAQGHEVRWLRDRDRHGQRRVPLPLERPGAARHEAAHQPPT